MLGFDWYNEHLKTLITVFGKVFSDVKIQRKDASGKLITQMVVPIEYAPKQKWFKLIEEDPEKNRQSSLSLPRLTYEISGMEYDEKRKLNTINRNYQVGNTTDTFTTQYSSVPYNISMKLYVISKTMDDGFNILEQILPFFTPQFNVKIVESFPLNIKKDVPFILESVVPNDSYQGSPIERRYIYWELTFKIRYDLYPIDKQLTSGIIKEVIVNLDNDGAKETIDIKVNPITASISDPYTITTDIINS